MFLPAFPDGIRKLTKRTFRLRQQQIIIQGKFQKRCRKKFQTPSIGPSGKRRTEPECSVLRRSDFQSYFQTGKCFAPAPVKNFFSVKRKILKIPFIQHDRITVIRHQTDTERMFRSIDSQFSAILP